MAAELDVDKFFNVDAEAKAVPSNAKPDGGFGDEEQTDEYKELIALQQQVKHGGSSWQTSSTISTTIMTQKMAMNLASLRILWTTSSTSDRNAVRNASSPVKARCEGERRSKQRQTPHHL